MHPANMKAVSLIIGLAAGGMMIFGLSVIGLMYLSPASYLIQLGLACSLFYWLSRQSRRSASWAPVVIAAAIVSAITTAMPLENLVPLAEFQWDAIRWVMQFGVLLIFAFGMRFSVAPR